MRRGLAPSAVLLLCASSAAASGFATARFGGEHGHPTTENPTAIYYNPAGLAASEGTHLFADGLFALRRASYEHQRESADTEEPPDAQGANHGKGTLLNFAAVPMLGASTKIGAFAFGIGAYVPFGGSEVWDDNTAFENDPKYPGPVDGVQRWYDIEGTIQSTYLTAAAAAELWDSGMSIGADPLATAVSMARVITGSSPAKLMVGSCARATPESACCSTSVSASLAGSKRNPGAAPSPLG